MPTIVALFAAIIGVSSNFITNALDITVRPYLPWVWVVFIASLIIIIIVSTLDVRGNWSETAAQPALPSLHSSSALALHQLPVAPADFTGRGKDILGLKTLLASQGSNICAVQGLAGVGKTTFALKLAEALSKDYSDGQIYLDLKGNSKQPLTAQNAMAHVVRSIYPAADPPNTDAELAGLYHSALHDRRMLLLMDNAFDEAQVETLIPPRSCLMLVTSRQHFSLPGMLTKNLDVLPMNDARDLLLKIAPRVGSSADQLADLCGFLPLALRVVGSVLQDRLDLKPTDCLKLLENREHRLQILDKVDASLRLSYEQLRSQLKTQWLALSVFDGSFDLRAAADLWSLDQQRASGTLGELLKYSLIEWNQSTERYDLHDLVRGFAAKWHTTSSKRHKTLKRHAAFYLTIVREANALYQQGGKDKLARAVAIFDAEWENIRAAQQWSESNSERDEDALKFCNAFADEAANLLALHRLPSERVAWFEAGLKSARRLKDRTAEGRHLVNLGRSYYLLDGLRGRAEELYMQGLSIAREIGDRPGEGQALGSLGVLLRESGESRRALTVFEERLKIAQELNDKRGEANTFGNLGRTHWTLGDLSRAISYCYRQLELAQMIGDRGNEARALGNLGQTYSVLKDYDRAINLSMQSLEIQQELGNRRAQGGALGDLGKTYERMGQLELARDFYERSLQIQREVGYRRAQGFALGNLGKVHKALGNMDAARHCHEQHLAIARETNDSVAEGISLFNTCFVFRALNDYPNAIRYAEMALAVFERIEDPHAAKVRAQIASWRARIAKL